MQVSNVYNIANRYAHHGQLGNGCLIMLTSIWLLFRLGFSPNIMGYLCLKFIRKNNELLDFNSKF